MSKTTVSVLFVCAVCVALTGCAGLTAGPGKVVPSGTTVGFTAGKPAGVSYPVEVDTDKLELPKKTPAYVLDAIKGKHTGTLLLNFDVVK